MPTGYTAGIEKGMSFQKFALQCARNFGALIEMRDEPMDAEIKLPVYSDYHEKELDKARKELKRLEGLTATQAMAACESDQKHEADSAAEYERSKIELRKKYQAMLIEVNAWNPPSPDHNGLKQFMVRQLEESISFDCSPNMPRQIESMEPSVWLLNKKKKAIHDIEYHEKENQKEIERVSQRRVWVSGLLDSFKAVAK